MLFYRLLYGNLRICLRHFSKNSCPYELNLHIFVLSISLRTKLNDLLTVKTITIMAVLYGPYQSSMKNKDGKKLFISACSAHG